MKQRRRKKIRLLGHANFLLPPEHQAAIEVAAVGGRDKSDLYRDAVKEYIEHHGITIPEPADVASWFGSDWVKKNKFEIGGENGKSKTPAR